MLALSYFRATRLVCAVLLMLLHVGATYDRTIGACKGKPNYSRYPYPGDCGKYIDCKHNKVYAEDCGGSKLYNLVTKTCENVTKNTACKGNDNVDMQRWIISDAAERNNITNGVELQRSTYEHLSKDQLDFFNQNSYNNEFGTLLTTYFLAWQNGIHIFTSKCKDWCKVWIKQDPCGKRELVLHQEIDRNTQSDSYVVRKPISLKFGSFYAVKVAHFVGANGTRELQIGVEWNSSFGWSNQTGQKPVVEDKISSWHLRMHVPWEGKCSRHYPSSTSTPTFISTLLPSRRLSTIQRASTSLLPSRRLSTIQRASTGLLPSRRLSTIQRASTSLLPSRRLSTIQRASTTVFPSRRLSMIQRISTSLSPSTAGSTVSPSVTSPTSKSDFAVKEFANNINDCLNAISSTNKTKQNCSRNSSKVQPSATGRAIEVFREVDKLGEEIAKNWTRKGEFIRISRPNIVMEVGFPTSNYSFPRYAVVNKSNNESSSDAKKEPFSDQIFIPAHVLVGSNGDFERKVFSVLYYDLSEKVSQSFENIDIGHGQNSSGVYKLSSRIIASVAVPHIGGLTNRDIVIKLRHVKTKIGSHVKYICAFYKLEQSNNGIWSTEGCTRDEEMSTNSLSVCRCNHLTHFGILMHVKDMPEMSPENVQALRLISYIGCGLSLIGVFLTVLTIGCLPAARSDRNFIHVNLALSIGFAQITFLAGIDETQNKAICTIVAALLHYFLLAAFSWMLIEGIFLHILIVKVFHDHLPKKRFYVTFCWVLPAAIVILSASLLTDGYGTQTSCWLSIDRLTIWTFTGPAILVITINIIILCKVMNEIRALGATAARRFNVRSVRAGVRSIIILLPLLGLTWALGLFTVNDETIVFQYLFAILNSLQGLLIFMFHCVFNTEVRKAFWRQVDLWFTTHHDPFASNGHSPRSLKKSREDRSSNFSQNNMKNDAPDPEHSSNDRNDSSGRKLSSITTSSYADSLSPNRSSPDSETMIKTYTAGKFRPTLANINDIKFQPCDVLPDENESAIKKYHSTSFIPNGSLKDYNGNTKSLEDVRNYHKRASGEDKAVAPDSEGKPLKKEQARTVSVGIGGKRMTNKQTMPEGLSKNGLVSNSRKLSTSDKTNALRIKKNRNSGSNVVIVEAVPSPSPSPLVECRSLKVDTKF